MDVNQNTHFTASDRHIGADEDGGSDSTMDRDSFEAMLTSPNSEGFKISDDERLRKELLKDLKVGRDAVRSAGLSSWWE